jgi:predicted O-methyltransferase YrrM
MVFPNPDDAIVKRCLAVRDGWADENKVRRMAQLCRDAKWCVEVGVWGGKSLLAMALSTKGDVYGIDPWETAASVSGWDNTENGVWWSSVDHEEIYKKCLALMSDLSHVKLMRMTSADASPSFADDTVDVVHIDGNHAEDIALSDVVAWTPKIKKEGCLILDDIDWPSTKPTQQWLLDNGWKQVENNHNWAVYRFSSSSYTNPNLNHE